jgi:hypothetical protein
VRIVERQTEHSPAKATRTSHTRAPITHHARMRSFSFLLFVIAACGADSSTRTVTSQVAVSATCRAIDGVAALLEPGATIVFGENHGTAEAPRFVGDVACHAAKRAPVTLALEIPRDEKARIDLYLSSAGTSADRDALLDGPFWHREDQDGRSSEAMLALIERARVDRLAIVAFDIADGVAPTTRDRDMAEQLAAARKAAPDRIFVGLTGNYHSRKTVGAPWDPAAVFMARHLEELGVAVTTLDVARDGGGAWVCMMADDGVHVDCGAHEAPPKPRARTWFVEIGDTEGHDGTYVVGPTTASPPAVR